MKRAKTLVTLSVAQKSIDDRMSDLVSRTDENIDEMVRLLEQTGTRKKADKLYRLIDGANHDLSTQKIWESCTFKWSD